MSATTTVATRIVSPAAFKGSVTTVLGIARPEARGEALAGLFLALVSRRLLRT